ncbi:uncharacterized protein LOC127277485 [Leptopilina boulardi]|uniref:uncharacterized protein LOC127277485 n=1 Tax=Leptopilina boulardi TaxID=63433 RepID=UPI0021F63280|nr:uncharacterized protein LOC127277485 [Leptopilina boulardi]
MDSSNFTSPLQAVQTISIFTYLNTLSDFLFAMNFLNETNQYQPIPIVNALYNYIIDDYQEDRISMIRFEFLKNNFPKHDYTWYNYSTINYCENRTKIIWDRKINLARKLIKGTDLYGGKENEILDPKFIDALYKHLISTLVFEKYTNINGFLVEIIRNSDDLKITTILERIFLELSKITFLSENGIETKLETMVILNILQDFIIPMFPEPKGHSLLSVDYVYAQAGAIFYLSIQSSSILIPMEVKNKTNEEFNQYIALGQAVEQLVVAEKIDNSALSIFTLPALFHYVYKEKQNLKLQSTKNIINNSTLVMEAYKMLFMYLNSSFAEVEKAKKNDYRYQFHLALSNFKNRTTLAREIIRSKCSSVKEKNLEDEVTKYKNNPDDYQCNSRNGKTLEDVNRLYQEQVDKITDKYFRYEKESIREAFGSEFIKSVDATKVEISMGLFSYIVNIIAAREFQWVKSSADLFRFNFIDNETSLYFAVLRENNEITLIQENRSVFNCSTISNGVSSTANSAASTDFASSTGSAASTDFASFAKSAAFTGSPSSANSADFGSFSKTPKRNIIQCSSAAFREKLELARSQKFSNYLFNYIKKHKNEKFDVFLNRIAEERATKFKESISLEGYDQTRKEWWKDFGLSLLPFYTCIHGIRTHHYQEAEIACSLDILFSLPLVGEIGLLAEKLTTAVTRSVLSSIGTTFGSLTLKMTIRETLEKFSVLVTNELSTLFTRETFKNLGLSVFRYLDPGFELIYTIGKGGLKSVISVINGLEKYSQSFKSVVNRLLDTETKLLNSVRKIETLFKKDVYVNSLTKSSGYGYKFLHFENQIVQVRKVQEYGESLPVILHQETDKITYRVLNTYTGRVKSKTVHLEDNFPQSKPGEFRIKSFHNSQTCLNSRNKRSLKKFLCLRNILRDRRKIIEKAAIDFTLQHSEELSEDVVRNQLKRFVFPGNGELQLNFVTEWRELIKSGKTNLPIWTKQYEIKNPDLFDKLRYSDAMDKWSISRSEAINRMNNVYPKAPSTSILIDPFVTKFYQSDKAFESVTFEDYFAIKNYMGNGYRRIARDTIEAKCMREALYRLAIRQSDDPIEEYTKTLYRGETRSPEIVEKLFFSNKREIEVNRFTSTSANRNIAFKFQYPIDDDAVRILYHIQFQEPYFRAKLENVVSGIVEEESVLLPGSKFRIDSVERTIIYGENILEVKLSFVHDEIPKYLWYQKIMDELEKLRKNNPGSYEIDPF